MGKVKKVYCKNCCYLYIYTTYKLFEDRPWADYTLVTSFRCLFGNYGNNPPVALPRTLEKNVNGGCSDYKRKWWKIWV